MDFNQIINRAKNMILNPVPEWEVVKQEAKPSKDILMNYVLPFVVLIGVCSFLGSLVFHMRYFSFGYALLSAIMVMIIAAAVVYITAWVMNELSTSFGSQKNFDAAFRLVAYSLSAYFVAASLSGLLSISVLSALISLCGLYSLYILWTGIGPMMATPEDKKAGYFVISILVLLVAYIILGVILGWLFLRSGTGYAGFR